MTYLRHPREVPARRIPTCRKKTGGDPSRKRHLDPRLRGDDAKQCAAPRLRGNDVVWKPGTRHRALGTRLAAIAVVLGIIISQLSISNASAQPLGQAEVGTAISARTVSPRFEHLTLEDGLSQGTIIDIFQDSRGFMWFSTQDGINRFDGHEVKSYTHQPFDETSLSAGFSFAIDEDSSGALWIANASGLNRLDPLTDKIQRFVHDADDSTSISSDLVWGVTIDSQNRLWASTNSGLSVMHLKEPGRFARYHYDAADPTSLCDNAVYSVFEDNANRIWVATKNGLCMLKDETQGRFDRVVMGPEPRPRGGWGYTDHEVNYILERPEEPGVLWLGGSRALIRVKASTREVERFVPDPDYAGSNVQQNTVWRLSQDPVNPSILWVPTFGGGLVRFDVRARRFITYHSDPADPNGLLEDALAVTFTDRSGMVWVGTQVNGVSRFSPSSVSLAHYRKSDRSDGSSLPGETVWGIHETRDDILWVGTQDKTNRDRLTALARDRGSSTHFEHDPANPSGRDPGTASLIYEDIRGNLWIGSDRGVDLLDRSTGRFRHFRTNADDPTAIPGAARAMLEDRSGNLWVGTFRGLARMRPEAFGTFEPLVHDPDDPTTITRGTVQHLIEDLAGFIWAGTARGLSRIDPETGEATRYEHDPKDRSTIASPDVNSVYERERESGVLWLALNGGGLDRLDVRSGEITHHTTLEGLPSNTVYGILEDDLGRLWLPTNHGLSRFDPETSTFKNFGVEIGLQGLEFAENSFHKSPSGEFFFGGTNGLNAFYPNELSENLNAPEVQLVDLKLFNQSVKSTGAVKLDKPVSETEEIHLDYSQKDVTFDFVAFHYADPSGNEYAYKLDGFNEDWVHVGGQRSASFTNLAPGEYTFHVKAANSDGIWNEEGASIRLVVDPPFWATWWFRALAFLGFVGLLYGGYSTRVRQIEDRARKLEGEVEKRTAELKESNDQLEQSHTIVEAINQETSFRRLLTKILEEARVIPAVEKATAVVLLPDGLFHVRASSGWDVADMQHIELTPEQANARYVEQATEVSEDIYVAKDVVHRAGTEQMAEFGKVASFLVLRVRVDNEVAGYLVFDNLSNENAFDQRDVALLERLREHITSAFIKTGILEDLQSTLDNLRSTQDRLIQSEKMASLGQLTAGIAHEIKNPLNFVNNFSDVTAELAVELAEEIEALKADLPADKAEEVAGMLESLRLNASKIGEHGKRADSIVKNMLEHSKVGEGERSSIDLNELLDEYVTLAMHGLEARSTDFQVRVDREYDDAVGRIDIVPQDMGRVFMNLLSNAFDALHETSSNNDAPAVYVNSLRTVSHVEVRIRDNGPGIPDKVKAKIFEPFYTTKPTGSGTGLGLSMSYDIVTKGHGGSLEVVSEEGEGAAFVVRLPV